MEAVNGVSSDTGGGDGGDGSTRGGNGPPAPSPLTGCYLLIVVGEPHSKEHADIILQRISKGERPLTMFAPYPSLGVSATWRTSLLSIASWGLELASPHCDAGRSMVVVPRCRCG